MVRRPRLQRPTRRGCQRGRPGRPFSCSACVGPGLQRRGAAHCCSWWWRHWAGAGLLCWGVGLAHTGTGHAGAGRAVAIATQLQQKPPLHPSTHLPYTFTHTHASSVSQGQVRHPHPGLPATAEGAHPPAGHHHRTEPGAQPRQGGRGEGRSLGLPGCPAGVLCLLRMLCACLMCVCGRGVG